jgi:hypothetical protein
MTLRVKLRVKFFPLLTNAFTILPTFWPKAKATKKLQHSCGQRNRNGLDGL